MREMLRSRMGLTLVELIVALSIAAVVLGSVGAAAYHFIRVPPEESDLLTVINDTNRALDWISDDGSMAQFCIPGEEGGAFYWMDRTASSISHSVFYSLDSNTGWLVRDEYIGGTLASSLAIAFYVSYVDFDFELQFNRVLVTVSSTLDSASRTATAYVYLRGQSLTYGHTLLAAAGAGKSINIKSTGVIIEGDVRTNGGIDIGGTGHALVDGQVYLTWDGDYDIKQPKHNDWPAEEDVIRDDPFPINWSLGLEDFKPYTYTFSGTVNLNSEDVWEEDGITLKPGIYYTDGTMNLNRFGARGRVTLIGKKVEITAGGTELMPFVNGVLLYGTACYSTAIKITASSGTWYGIFYAPNYDVEKEEGAEVELRGGGYELYGAIAAWMLTINPSGGQILIKFQW